MKLFSQIKKHIIINQHIRNKLPQELLLMKGKSKSNSKNQSILFFTVHRCASRYTTNILRQMLADSLMIHIDLSAYIWSGGKIYKGTKDIYRSEGYLYGPFYGLDKEELNIPVNNYKDFKILLLLRDPRDVLTSYYFHHAYQPYYNPAQQDVINMRAEKASRKTVDEWVLEMIPLFKNRYITYLETFGKESNVLLLKYEDMIHDFNNWLNSLIKFTNMQPKEETLKSIVREVDFSVNKEDVKSHKRQVTPGDHTRKLKENTIKILNSEFREILAELDYK